MLYDDMSVSAALTGLKTVEGCYEEIGLDPGKVVRAVNLGTLKASTYCCSITHHCRAIAPEASLR